MELRPLKPKRFSKPISEHIESSFQINLPNYFIFHLQHSNLPIFDSILGLGIIYITHLIYFDSNGEY